VNRRYLLLFGGIVAVAILLSLLGRMPRPREQAPIPVASVPRATLEITIDGNRVQPELTQVEKDHEVELVVVNRGRSNAALTLAGYEDRVSLRVGPGGRGEARFLADRPGDGFAWLVNGEQAGRFVVAGSHLVEGHR
jgi:hypothetical protein